MRSVEWSGAGLCRPAIRSCAAAMPEGQLLDRGTEGHREGDKETSPKKVPSCLCISVIWRVILDISLYKGDVLVFFGIRMGLFASLPDQQCSLSAWGRNLSPNLRVENDGLLGCLPPNVAYSGTLFRPFHPGGKFKNATEITECYRFNSKDLLHAIELFY